MTKESGDIQKYLIITADDFGYSDPRDDGIVECFNHGAISNVSLMVNGYAVVNAVKKAKTVGMPMGLHLNLTEGSPVSTPEPKTLVGQDGFLLGKMGCREAVSKGLVDQIEIRTEIQGQIDKFEELTGSKPVSVDGHQHIHVIPGICEIFAEVLHINGIQFTRLPIESPLDEHANDGSVFKNQVIKISKNMEHVLCAAKIKSPGFTGLKTMGKAMTVKSLHNCIKETYEMEHCAKYGLGKGKPTCELMTHPGKKTGDHGGCGGGPDTFSQSADREHEKAVLLSQDMKNFYEKSGIHLVSFKDL